ncbi:hypothetical protein [Endozoicomonas sp. GU-1]|uniref:hypothetical protein n=1 Tax=Endozoicomonas sp. GU-1 TaxID=3009078 RepID=UPI0022B47205|nr:hypothetical protein [Endozoicomonas sp. GU-1]WBA83740.1 hypothetical protein O2T12_11790 [Endozoicomonas sp. GU-1]WBA86721.1 hypothetical protein O3276_01360 [Endozoicomonas sp. GU-1]
MQLDTIALPDDLLWIDEFRWNPVEQSTERSLTGALLVQEGQLKQGRPITLSGKGEAGWVTRQTVKSLLALSKSAGLSFDLTLPDNRTFTVIFDRSSGAPVEAEQVMTAAYPTDDDFYFLTLRLLTVEPV